MIVPPVAHAWDYATAHTDVQRRSLLDLVQMVSGLMHGALRAIAIDHEGETVKLTCSIGVHTMDTIDCADPSAAIERADQALDQAKRRGRDQIVVFQGADERATSDA